MGAQTDVIDAPSSGRRSGLVGAAGVLAAALAVWTYRDVFSAPFLGDDFNEILRAAAGWRGGRWFEPADGVAFFRPVTWASLWWDHRIAGADPRWYHAVNLGLHVVASALVVACTAALVERSASRPATALRWVAPVAGLVFLLHPSHGEPVRWVAARADLLATVFGLLSVWGFLVQLDRTGRTARLARVGSVVAFGLGLVSKEHLIVLPAVLGAVAWCSAPTSAPGAASWRWLLRSVAPYLGIVAVCVASRWLILGTPVGGYEVSDQIRAGPLRLMLRLVALVGRAFLPPAPLWVWILAAVGVVAAAAGASTRRGAGVPESRLAVTCAAALLILVAPMAGLGVSPHAATGERMVYLATVPASILVALGLVALGWAGRRVALVATAVVLVAALAVGEIEASRWRSSGLLAAEVQQALAQETRHDSRYVVNMPDTVNGAISLRNAGGGISRLLPGDRGGAVFTVSSVAFATADDTFEVSVTGDESAGWSLTVHPSAPSQRIRLGAADQGPWTVTPLGAEGYEVRFDESVSPSQVRYVSGGGVHPVRVPSVSDLGEAGE